MRRNEKHLAFCGLDCSQCAAFIATLNNDQDLRVKTAREWTERYKKGKRHRLAVKPEDINCQGCLSTVPIYLYCRQCKIRKCAREKALNSCQECQNYKCSNLIELQKYFFKKNNPLSS